MTVRRTVVFTPLAFLRWVALPAVSVSVWAYALAAGDLRDDLTYAILGDEGRPNGQTVDAARDFAEFPVLWLDREYRDLPLSSVLRNTRSPYEGKAPFPGPSTGQSFEIFYGSCAPVPGGECNAPLQIFVDAGGATPPAEAIPGEIVWRGPYEVRGVMAMDLDFATVLWFDNGLAVTLRGDADLRRMAANDLMLANAGALNVAEVLEGDDLVAVGRIELH